jgi:hypothetical protein
MDKTEYESYFATNLLQGLLQVIQSCCIEINTPCGRLLAVAVRGKVKDTRLNLLPVCNRHSVSLTFPVKSKIKESTWRQRVLDILSDTVEHTNQFFYVHPVYNRSPPFYNIYIQQQQNWSSIHGGIIRNQEP